MALLTPKQAASELAISDKQLRVLTEMGEIAYINIGCGRKRETRRYEPSAIAAFIERRRGVRVPVQGVTSPINFIDGSDFFARREERRTKRLK